MVETIPESQEISLSSPAWPVSNPLSQMRPELASLRVQGQAFLVSLAQVSNSRGGDPHSVLRREALGELGGAISKQLLGRRRVGSGIVRAYVDANQRSQEFRREQQARIQALSLLHQVRTRLDACSATIGLRMAQSLRRVLAEAETARRPETIVRRTLAVIGRLEAFKPKLGLASKEPPYSDALRRLEGELRHCIELRLSSLDPNWWEDRVPPLVRGRAERRRTQREKVWPWLNGSEQSIVNYLSFPEYADVILDNRNWEQIFVMVFKDADALRVKLRELEPIRNDIFHARVITKANGRRLQTYSEDIVRAIHLAH